MWVCVLTHRQSNWNPCVVVNEKISARAAPLLSLFPAWLTNDKKKKEKKSNTLFLFIYLFYSQEIHSLVISAVPNGGISLVT